MGLGLNVVVGRLPEQVSGKLGGWHGQPVGGQGPSLQSAPWGLVRARLAHAQVRRH